jgi:hypothetical protein
MNKGNSLYAVLLYIFKQSLFAEAQHPAFAIKKALLNLLQIPGDLRDLSYA